MFPHSVHVTATTHDYVTPTGRAGSGVATSWLQSLKPKGECLLVSLQGVGIDCGELLMNSVSTCILLSLSSLTNKF